jgi:Asp-tRNA(Asn)/Glu-tRNA(Gln) amidotransferase A subunit family amidase
VGRTNWNPHLLACTVPGHLADATGLAIPWGTFAGTALPRAIQLLGPPGSESALLAMAEKLAPPTGG